MKEIYESLNIELFDSEGQLRSSYEVFSDLAAIWDTLDKNTQNYIASQQAGTNQFQTFAALMQNFSTATEATTTALNSAGSAANENAAYMDSLEAKTSAVSASFEKLANSVIDSEVVKTVLDAVNSALTLLNTPLGKAITQFTLLTGVITGVIGVFGPIVSKIGSMITAVKQAGSVISLLTSGIAGFTAATVPVAAILSGVVVAIGAVATAVDYFTVSLEEQKEKVNSLSNELSNLQSEYDSLASNSNLTAADEQRLQVLKAQIEANKTLLEQEAQKQYSMQWGEESSTTGVLDSQINAYNEATEKVKKYETAVNKAQGELDSASWGSDAYDKATEKLHKAQKNLSDAQNEQKKYNEIIEKSGDTTYTNLERLEDKMNVLDDYNDKIEENQNKIIELYNAEGDHSKEILKLSEDNAELTSKAEDLNSTISTQIDDMTSLSGNMKNLDSDAQNLIDRYVNMTQSAKEGTAAIERMIITIKELSDVDIVPQGAEDMEDFLRTMSSSDMSKLQTILKGLGSDASTLSEILGHMSGEDAIRLINAAYKEYYGTIEDGTEALSNFQKALETNYGEGLANELQALDYVTKSQEQGIKNYQAYKEAMLATFGTMEVTAEDQKRYSESFMSYFKDGAFQAQVLVDKLQNAEGAWNQYVEVVDQGDGSLGLTISDFSALAESLDLTEPMLWHMVQAMEAYGDVNISDNINAAQVALQDLAEELSENGSEITSKIREILGGGTGGYGITDGKIELDAEFELDVSAEELEEVQNMANDLLQNTGFEFSFDVDASNAEEALTTIYNGLRSIEEYVDESGNWDFSGLVEDLGDLEGVTIDGSNITFDTDEAAKGFVEQLVGQISADAETQAEQLDFAGTILKNMENSGYTLDFSKIVDADTNGKTIASQLTASINSAMSTEQIAWGDSLIQGADNLGMSLDTTKEKADSVKTGVDDAASAVEKLNGKSLSSVTTQLNNASTKAGNLKSNLNQSLSYLNNLTGKTWTINTVWSTSGTKPTFSANGMRAFANGKGVNYQPLRYSSDGTSLTGEEGEELLIGADGSQKLVGTNGPELVNVKSGDTIIPANVTAMIRKGQIGTFAGGRTGGTASIVSNIGPISVGDVSSVYDGSTITSTSSNTTATKNNTSATKSNSSAKKASASANSEAAKATDELTDAIEEQSKLFDEQNDITEHNIFIREKQGATTAELVKLNKAYQDQIHKQADWFRSQGLEETSEEIREAQKQWWSIYDDIIDLQRESFDERLKDSEDYIDERNDLDEWGADNEIAAWNRVVEWMDEWYSQGLIDYEYYLEKRTDAAKKAAEAEKEAWKEAKEAQIDDLEEQVNIYEILFSAVADRAQEEIDALQAHRDEVEEYWNNKIDALQQANDELDDQIAKEEALDALARARQTKIMVYKDGRFQYINDIDEVSDAQANLEKIERDEILKKELENLEELRDKELASIDEQIKGWEDYKEEWSSVVDEYEKEQDRLLLEQELGIKLEGENWEERLDNLESYVQRYKELLKELQIAEEELEEEEDKPSGGGGSSTGSQIGNVVGSVVGGLGGMGTVGSIVTGTVGSIIGGVIGSVVDKVTSSSSSSSSSGGKTYNATASGNAPAGATIGDTIHTSGGNYKIVSSSTPGAAYNPSSGHWSVKVNAKGTTNFEGGMSLVGEEGPELGVFAKGTGIIPADVTKNLWSWGSITPSELIQKFGINSSSSAGTFISIDKFSPTLPNVQNGQDFVNYLSTNFRRQVIQYQGT